MSPLVAIATSRSSDIHGAAEVGEHGTLKATWDSFHLTVSTAAALAAPSIQTPPPDRTSALQERDRDGADGAGTARDASARGGADAAGPARAAASRRAIGATAACRAGRPRPAGAAEAGEAFTAAASASLRAAGRQRAASKASG